MAAWWASSDLKVGPRAEYQLVADAVSAAHPNFGVVDVRIMKRHGDLGVIHKAHHVKEDPGHGHLPPCAVLIPRDDVCRQRKG